MDRNLLHLSHSIEKDKDGITGSYTYWCDDPSSVLDVGDTFRPVPDWPLLRVDKVSIKDNVIGEFNGKPLRQWEVTIDGSNMASNSEEKYENTDIIHIKYNFSVAKDEASGSMEVTNKGDKPMFEVVIGGYFSVPGIGALKCSEIKGSDSYDDDGVHTWTLTYEGYSKDEEDDDDDTSENQEKYSFTINSDGGSGSKEVVSKKFYLEHNIDENFHIPNLGHVKCTNIKASNSYDDNGEQSWTIVYEGEIENEEKEINERKYSGTIAKQEKLSGSLEETNEGETPEINYAIGEFFRVPGIGSVKCTNVKVSSSLNDKGETVWTVTYEGESENKEENNTKYSGSISKQEKTKLAEKKQKLSGSLEETNKGDSPKINHNIGETFSIPGIGSVKCTNVKVSSSLDDNGETVWTATYEGETENEEINEKKYSGSIAKQEKTKPAEKKQKSSGSLEETNKGEKPEINHSIGETFSIPGIGTVKCTNVKVSSSLDDNGETVWTVTYEGESENKDIKGKDKYSGSISKQEKTKISERKETYSGSIEETIRGDRPTLSYSIGSILNVPGVGSIKCTNIKISSSLDDDGETVWNINYEGESEREEEYKPKYSGTISRQDNTLLKDNKKKYSGSIEETNKGETPKISHGIGSTFDIPGIDELQCTNVKVSSSINDNGETIWTVTYEGESESEDNFPIKYTFTNAKDGSSGTKEVTTKSKSNGTNPTIEHSPGEPFSVLGLGSVICTSVKASDSYNDKGEQIWTVTYEGHVDGKNSDLSEFEEEISTSYELNGITVRTVAGELLALRRSTTEITKKSIVVYTKTENAVATIGGTYRGGIALRENVVKEVVKVNGTKIKEYYKHTIEVES